MFLLLPDVSCQMVVSPGPEGPFEESPEEVRMEEETGMAVVLLLKRWRLAPTRRRLRGGRRRPLTRRERLCFFKFIHSFKPNYETVVKLVCEEEVKHSSGWCGLPEVAGR